MARLSRSSRSTHAADHVQLALEGVLVGHVVARAHEQLGDPRRDRARGAPAGGLVHRHLAPAEHGLALGLDPLLEQPHRLGGVARGQEADGHAVAAGLGQLEARLGAQEGVGKLDQDAGAVPGVGVGALGASVLEALQRVQRPLHDIVGRGRADPCDEGDAAGVVLVARVVQATGCLQWGYLPVYVACSAQAHGAETNAKL